MARISTGYKGIFIDGSGPYPVLIRHKYKMQNMLSFRMNINNDLDKINKYPLGSELLDLIGQRSDGVGTSNDGRIVLIRNRPLYLSKQGPGTSAKQPLETKHIKRTISGHSMMLAGKGSTTTVYIHNEKNSQQEFEKLTRIQTPTWIVLAHELIHALHHLSGTVYAGNGYLRSKKYVARREEMFTTGLGVYSNTRISENSIRKQAGLETRKYYGFQGDYTLFESLSDFRPLGFWPCSCIRGELLQ